MVENGVGDMEIDGNEQKQKNIVPDWFDANYRKIYYGKLFPYADFFKWMSYGNDGKHPGSDQSYFGRREFSFTLDNNIYLRFQSFNSLSEMENSIKEKYPFKFDIGPVYSVDPAKRRAYAGDNVFTPVERELVFDIDMSDYDDVRYCCSGADFCLDCWPLMTAAIKVIVSPSEMTLDLSTYCGYLVVDVVFIVGSVMAKQEGCLMNRELPLLNISIYIRRSYIEVLEDNFESKLLCSQKYFSTEERYEKILDMIHDESITSELRGRWHENRRPSKKDVNSARWEQLKNMLQSGKHKAQGMRRRVEEIVFSFTYPRLDLEVTKHMNHLLKAPFCVHPQTGRVCVPINPERCDEFDPTTVPTVAQLLEELNAADMIVDGETDWDRTSLGESIRFFRSSFLQPLLKSCKEEIESSYNAKLQQSKNSLSW